MRQTYFGTKGSDVLSISYVNNGLVDLGNGADVFYGAQLNGGDIYMGAGSDLASLFGTTDTFVYGGEGVDRFRVEGGIYNGVIDTQGPSLIQFINTDRGLIVTGDDNDVVQVTGGTGDRIYTNGGDDQITITNPVGNMNIDAGAGDDTIVLNISSALGLTEKGMEFAGGLIDLGAIRGGDGANSFQFNFWESWADGSSFATLAKLSLPDFDLSKGDTLFLGGTFAGQIIVSGSDIFADSFGPYGQPMRLMITGPGAQLSEGVRSAVTFAYDHRPQLYGYYDNGGGGGGGGEGGSGTYG